ncbi:MAG: type 4a pilus biogenesis protein PilO [Lacipirellulaceae bacterium]
MRPGQPTGPKLPTGAPHALALGCALAIGAVAYVGLYRPLAGWRIDLDHTSELVRSKLAGAGALRRDHAALVAELDELRARVQRVSDRIPDEANEGAFLADLSRLAREHDVRIQDFRRSTAETHDTHAVMPVAVTAEGTHAGLCAVFAGREDLPRLAPIKRLVIERGALESRYNVQLECSLYYGMRTPAQADPVLAAAPGGGS